MSQLLRNSPGVDPCHHCMRFDCLYTHTKHHQICQITPEWTVHFDLCSDEPNHLGLGPVRESVTLLPLRGVISNHRGIGQGVSPLQIVGHKGRSSITNALGSLDQEYGVLELPCPLVALSFAVDFTFDPACSLQALSQGCHSFALRLHPSFRLTSLHSFERRALLLAPRAPRQCHLLPKSNQPILTRTTFRS